MSAVLTTPEVSELGLGSEWLLYELAKAGRGLDLSDGTVVRPIRVGRRVVWPAAPILAALGLAHADTGPASNPRPDLTLAASESPSSGGVADGSA